eukprot:80492_1
MLPAVLLVWCVVYVSAHWTKEDKYTVRGIHYEFWSNGEDRRYHVSVYPGNIHASYETNPRDFRDNYSYGNGRGEFKKGLCVRDATPLPDALRHVLLGLERIYRSWWEKIGCPEGYILQQKYNYGEQVKDTIYQEAMVECEKQKLARLQKQERVEKNRLKRTIEEAKEGVDEVEQQLKVVKKRRKTTKKWGKKKRSKSYIR